MLQIPFLKITELFKELNLLRSNGAALTIESCQWSDFLPTNVKCSLSLAHDNDNIIFLFDVFEEEILFNFNKTNQPVCRDSCVELFLMHPSIEGYYNFEFNCKGVCLAAFGANREQRTLLKDEQIDQIERYSTISGDEKVNSDGLYSWSLIGRIPIVILDQPFNLFELKSGNFYKCGDDQQKPHYLSWNPIKSPKPDFHRPEFFASLQFLPQNH